MPGLHLPEHPAERRRPRAAQAPRWPVYLVVGLSLLVSLTLWVALIGTISAIFHDGF